MSELAKEEGWAVSTTKIDKQLESAILNLLRDAKAPQAVQHIAAHLKTDERVVEHYLTRLEEQRLAQYVPGSSPSWGWVAIDLTKN